MGHAYNPRIDVLVVCSGNICRSPMAAGLLAELLDRTEVACTVGSAGFLTEDRPASDHGVALMQERGIDLAGHRSRRLTSELVADADLVLCMERAHVREVAVLHPDAFDRTFTLPELARRATEAGPRLPDETVGDWLRRVGRERRPGDLVAHVPEDEVPDPYGGPRREYRRTAEQIEALLRVVVEHLHP